MKFLLWMFILCLGVASSRTSLSMPTSRVQLIGKSPDVKTKRLPWVSNGVKNGVSSALSAAVVKAILQPFDTIKTIQQLQVEKLNALDTAVSIVKERGVAGLWSGVGITVFGASPATAMYFSIYTAVRDILVPVFPTSLKLVAWTIAAVVGNTFASVLRVPYELFKQRLQAGEHETLWEALEYSYDNEGLVGIFGSGKLASQILRDVPFAVFVTVSYELLKAILNQRRRIAAASTASGAASAPSKRGKKMEDLVCGAIAGGVGSFLTNPMDVVKTRLMAANTRYSSISEAVVRIAKEEGLSTFLVGTSSRLAHKIPANGLFYLFYEMFLRVLGAEDSTGGAAASTSDKTTKA